MANDTIVTPDGRVLAKYPNIQVGRDIFPYQDLKIAGRWTRDAGIPDDIIPMIGPPIGYDDTWTPRVFRLDDTGALKTVSSGGGGSSAGIVPITQPTFNANSWQVDEWNTYAIGNNKIFKLSWTVAPKPGTVAPNISTLATFVIASAANDSVLFHIDNVSFIQATAGTFYPLSYSNTLVFQPSALDLSATVGPADLFSVRMTDHVQFTASFNLILA